MRGRKGEEEKEVRYCSHILSQWAEGGEEGRRKRRMSGTALILYLGWEEEEEEDGEKKEEEKKGEEEDEEEVLYCYNILSRWGRMRRKRIRRRRRRGKRRLRRKEEYKNAQYRESRTVILSSVSRIKEAQLAVSLAANLSVPEDK